MPESEIPQEVTGLLVTNLDAGNIVDQLDKLEGTELIDKKTNTDIYSESMELYEEACMSMTDWKKKYDKALKLAKMQPTTDGGIDHDNKDFPFEGASTAMLPYIFEAMLDFHGRSVPELVWTDQLVKVKINGAPKPEIPKGMPEEERQKVTGEIEAAEKVKEDRSDRVSTYSNYQLINDIPLWRDSTDKGLLALPCVGMYYKKTYYDSDLKTICSDLKLADEVKFNIKKNDVFKDAPDKFEEVTYSRNELIAFIRGDQEWDIDEDKLEKDKNEFEFIEAHTWIDLDEDGIKEPYCAILYEQENKVVCLYPDYDEDTITLNDGNQVVKIKDKDIYTQFIFLPDPEGGPMGIGWGILLGPMFKSINTLLRDNLDAGTLSLTTANSGLIASGIGKGRGNRQEAGEIDVKQGQLTPVPMGGLVGSLQNNVVQFPFKGPSETLFNLMTFLIESSHSMTTASYATEAVPGEPASLYLAKLMQGLKKPNSIIARVYGAQKIEYGKIGLLNFKHHDSAQYNKVLDLPHEANMKADFNPDDCDINLVADPTQGSDFERVAKAQNVLDEGKEEMSLSGGRTNINMREAQKKLFEALGVTDIDLLLPEPPEGPSEQEKLQMAQQAMQAEFLDREMTVKERKLDLESDELEISKLKQAHDAAIELGELGLQSDIDESVITKNYAEALAKLVEKAGLSYIQARSEVTKIEADLIDAEGGMNGRQVQAINSGSNRALAR